MKAYQNSSKINQPIKPDFQYFELVLFICRLHVLLKGLVLVIQRRPGGGGLNCLKKITCQDY